MKPSLDLSNLIAFSLREAPWPELVKFDLDFDVLEKTVGGHLHWVIWGYAFQDFLTRDWEPEGNVFDRHLKRRGWREPALAMTYPATHWDSRSFDCYPPYPAARRLEDTLSAWSSGMHHLDRDHPAKRADAC